MKRILIALLIAVLVCCFVGCDSPDTPTSLPSQSVTGTTSADLEHLWQNYSNTTHNDTAIEYYDGTFSKVEENKMEHPIAKIVLQSGKEIELELYPEIAPITVANFIYLANEKNLYDGLTFHRIIDNFMVQGGDPAGDGTGGPGYNIKGEFAINGVENNISHKTGVISMARRSYPYDSAGSQFFICVADATYLDGQYAAFGKVISGLENVLALGKVDTDYNDRPLEPQVIAAIRVDTRGASYEKPEGAK